MFNSGIRPAIDAGSSVSRVGGSAQIKAMKKVAGTLRLDLASYRELEAFTQFGSDLDAATQAKLNRGRRTIEVLKQPLHKPLPVEKQVVILYALTHGFLDSVPVDQILDLKKHSMTTLIVTMRISLKLFVQLRIFLRNLYLMKLSKLQRSIRIQIEIGGQHMAGSLREIQAKIASTKKTSQITGAMQMVSASKIDTF